MLRITIDINGRVLGTIAAVRSSEGTNGTNTYEVYEITDVSDGESVVEHGEFITEISHTYEDGAATLSEKVLSEIDEL